MNSTPAASSAWQAIRMVKEFASVHKVTVGTGPDQHVDIHRFEREVLIEIAALVQIFNLSDAGQCSEYISCGEHGLPHFGGAVGMI